MHRQTIRIGAATFLMVAFPAVATSQPVTLTHQQHAIRDNRTQLSQAVTGQPALSYSFERNALGEKFQGVLQVTLPETISGVASPNPNGSKARWPRSSTSAVLGFARRSPLWSARAW